MKGYIQVYTGNGKGKTTAAMGLALRAAGSGLKVYIATYFKLFSVEDLLDFMGEKPKGVELVITGRMADPKVIDKADLVTEMKEVKHYYQKGITARDGIEK
jgi:ATP:corrinoid adenosyltransferase